MSKRRKFSEEFKHEAVGQYSCVATGGGQSSDASDDDSAEVESADEDDSEDDGE